MTYKTTPAEFKITRVRECAPAHACNSPEDCLAYWASNIVPADWFSSEREQVITLLLSARMRPIGHHLLSIGTLNESAVHPRETLRPAIIHSAYAFILMHNHPSSDATPSRADHHITQQIQKAADLLQIHFYDHIIVGNPWSTTPSFSFREAGIL
jgi:DNA repair protein RadC